MEERLQGVIGLMTNKAVRHSTANEEQIEQAYILMVLYFKNKVLKVTDAALPTPVGTTDAPVGTDPLNKGNVLLEVSNLVLI